jgi:allantoate deiminase
MDSFEIPADVVARRIEELGRVGRLPEGGLYRGVYTPAWATARAMVAEWGRAAGLEVREDAVGNLWLRLPGTEPGPAIVTGSHIDTVRNGGKYDGALGIIAGLTAVEVLKARFGRPKRTLEVLATCEEDGARFRSRLWGSRAILGVIRPEEPDSILDAEGVSIGEAMRRLGFDPARIPEARRDDIGAFIELHIEQGPVLETSGHQVGIVTVVTGLTMAVAEVTGRADHAGTTPMDARRDALVGAARMILAVRRAALTVGRPAAATVGRIEAWPGGSNVVPERVRFTIDIRHTDEDQLRRLENRVARACRQVARNCDLGLDFRVVSSTSPTPLDPALRRLLVDLASGLGLKFLEMPSGAGHDAAWLARRFPAAMIFVPSRDGRSHSPLEYTPVEQITPGIALLAAALHRLAY